MREWQPPSLSLQLPHQLQGAVLPSTEMLRELFFKSALFSLFPVQQLTTVYPSLCIRAGSYLEQLRVFLQGFSPSRWMV